MRDKLRQIGLTERETDIYLLLVKTGSLSANEIARVASLNRTVAYNILQQLVDKGLVSSIRRDKKQVFMIEEPESLLAEIREKERITKELVGQIKAIKKISLTKGKVNVSEGVYGLRALFEELRLAKDVRVLNATGLLFEHLRYSAGHIVRDMLKHGKPKVIAVHKMRTTPLADFDKLSLKYLPKNADNNATTFIYGNNVVIQVLKDKPFIIKIEDKDISLGYKKDFDVLWNLI